MVPCVTIPRYSRNDMHDAWQFFSHFSTLTGRQKGHPACKETCCSDSQKFSLRTHPNVK